MMVAQRRVKVDLQEIDKANDGSGWKRKFIHATIEGLSENEPFITLDLGELGYRRIVSVIPQPLGEHFSVVWDGNLEQPGLSFDGWTDGPVRVALDITGR